MEGKKDRRRVQQIQGQGERQMRAEIETSADSASQLQPKEATSHLLLGSIMASTDLFRSVSTTMISVPHSSDHDSGLHIRQPTSSPVETIDIACGQRYFVGVCWFFREQRDPLPSILRKRFDLDSFHSIVLLHFIHLAQTGRPSRLRFYCEQR